MRIMHDIDQLDLFLANLVDVPIKSDQVGMEYPLFALSKNPDTAVYRWEAANGNWLEVIPPSIGRATIWDKDLLLHSISQIHAAKKRGDRVSRRIQFNARDFLVSTRRTTGGRGYTALHDTVARLRGTTFRTKIKKLSGTDELSVFGLVDDANIVVVNGSVEAIDITLSQRLFESIQNDEVLTINPQYYALKSANDRRLYELIRKHCGNQAAWEIGFEKLYEKFGTRGSKSEFRRYLKNATASQPIPDYMVEFLEKSKTLRSPAKLRVLKDSGGEHREDAMEAAG